MFRIQRWDARDCIVLLTLSTATLSDGTTVIIWFKLSESIRENILRRYEIEYKKVVAKPFPPDGLLSAHDHQSRLIALAEALREKVGAVDAIWRRKRRGKLSELDWLKTAELEGTAFLAQGVSSYPAITRTCRKGNGSANDDRSV